MEEEPAALKRRNSVPASVVIPTNFEVIPPVKPRKSPSAPIANGHNHYGQLPPSSPPPSSSSPSVADYYELVSLKSSPTYTSLKDLLPTSPSLLSPTPVCAVAGVSSTTTTSTSSGGVSTLSGYEISIRNRLVKQAAWAYLQPMASSPSASRPRLLRYFSGDFIKPLLSSIKGALVYWAARACNWLADALWLLLCR